MAQLMDLMKNQRKRKNIFGQEITETRPMSETANAAGLRAQPTDAVTTGQLGGTPKQQEMAGAKQTQDAALQQAQSPELGNRLATQQRQQQAFKLPQSGDTVEAARGLIESAAQARQVDIEDIIKLPDHVKRDPAVKALLDEFPTASQERRQVISTQLQQIAAQSVGAETMGGLSDVYNRPLEGQDIAANYFEDPEEFNSIVNTLSQAGIPIEAPEQITFAELEQRIQDYSDSITGQVDQALELLADESAPPQLKETARQALRDLGASALIATDYQLENLEEELEGTDQYTVKVDGRELTGTIAELLSDPTMTGVTSALLAELTSVSGATSEKRNQRQLKLLNSKIAANPDLEFIYRSVFNNVDAYEAILENDIAQAAPAVEVLTDNERIRQEVVEKTSEDVAKLLDLGVQLTSYSDPLINVVTSTTPDGMKATESINKLADSGMLPSMVDKIRGLPEDILADRLGTVAEAAPLFRGAKQLLDAGATSQGLPMVTKAFQAAKIPGSLLDILSDARKYPDRYSPKQRELLSQLDPDGDGGYRLDELGDLAIDAILGGSDFGELPRMSKRDSLRMELQQQARGVLQSPEYTKVLGQIADPGRNSTQLMQDGMSLFGYAQQLQKMADNAPEDVRSSINNEIAAVQNRIDYVNSRRKQLKEEAEEARRKRAEEARKLQEDINRQTIQYAKGPAAGKAFIPTIGPKTPAPAPQKTTTIDTTGGVFNPFAYNPNRKKGR